MDSNEKILIETQERAKSNTKRLDSLEEEVREIKSEQKAIYEIASSVKVLVERVGHIEGKVDETSRKIDIQTEQWRSAESKLSSRISEAQTERDHHTAEGVDKVRLAFITAICSALATALITTLLNF